MITLFDQNRKYYNQNKIFYLNSHMAPQTAPLIGTMETLNSIPGSSDRHAQRLTAGDFRIN